MLFSCRPVGLGRLFAIATLAGIVVAGCAQPAPPPPPPVAVVEAPVVIPEDPPAPNPLDRDQASFLRLPGTPDGVTPVRVGIILPLSSTNAGTRALAQSMLKAAQLAMFDANNPAMVLMVEDEGNGGAPAAAAARRLLAQGSEVIVGPLFAASVNAVAPVTRDRGVPVLAFSTEKTVAGRGIYLISFLPENEVARVVSFAAQRGHKRFAALVPRNAYGTLASEALREAVTNAKGETVAVTDFAATVPGAQGAARGIVAADADALLIAQGGAVLRAMVPVIQGREKIKLLGTGLWDEDALTREAALDGGWYAAPEPQASTAFNTKYRSTFDEAPANIASLAYDAVALVALLSSGEPYKRFTKPALMDPNGFTGISGIFRFRPDGASERGLAVMQLTPEGPEVISPAPKTFLRGGQ